MTAPSDIELVETDFSYNANRYDLACDVHSASELQAKSQPSPWVMRVYNNVEIETLVDFWPLLSSHEVGETRQRA